MGLSIPSNLVQHLLPQLIRGEDIRRTFLGVRLLTINPQQARDSDLGIERGVQILHVTPGSPAQKAGLRGSRSMQNADIVTAIDGVEINRYGDLTAFIQAKDVGDTITITVYRNGETLELQATLGAWPES